MQATLFQSATDAAQAVRRKEVSSRELTELLLARIDVANSAVNAVVELQREVRENANEPESRRDKTDSTHADDRHATHRGLPRLSLEPKY